MGVPDFGNQYCKLSDTEYDGICKNAQISHIQLQGERLAWGSDLVLMYVAAVLELTRGSPCCLRSPLKCRRRLLPGCSALTVRPLF
jgi:hypothetical protein